MRNQVMMWGVVCVLLLGAGGCFSVRMSDGASPLVTEETGFFRCTAKAVTGLSPRLTYDAISFRYKLELYATGDFVIHDVKKVTTQSGLTPRLYFGMFPGIHKDGVYPSKDAENEDIAIDSLLLLSYNLIVPWAITTAYALFVEPFGDYHAHVGVAATALLGFSKRLVDEGGGEMKHVSFKETGSSRPSTTAKLYGYNLEIEGRKYDGTSGDIRIGAHDFGQELRRGRRLSAKFITAPSLRQDSDDLLQDLEGFEFEIACP